MFKIFYLKNILYFSDIKQRFLNVTHRQMLTHRSSQNAQATFIHWGGQAERIKNSLETGQPTTLQERRQYYAITTSAATASLDDKQDGKIPQSLGSGLGMRKTKNICRLNGNLCCHSLFLFFLLPCIPQSSVPYFSSSSMESSRERKAGGGEYQRTTEPSNETWLLWLQTWRGFRELLHLKHCLMLLGC